MDRPWLEHYAPGVPATIDCHDVTITQRLATQATAKLETVVALYKGAQLTYRQLNTATNQMADAVQQLGGEHATALRSACPTVPGS